jgi:hypothetical protein
MFVRELDGGSYLELEIKTNKIRYRKAITG